MPKAVEDYLKRLAMKKFGSTTSPKARAYIYGTLQKKTHWRPSK